MQQLATSWLMILFGKNPIRRLIWRGAVLHTPPETLIWAAKSKKSKYFFDYQKMRKINNDKQMQSV